MQQNLIDLVTRASRATESVLDGLTAATAFRPNPCRPMTEADVATHLVDGVRAFTTVAEGGELRFGPGGEGDEGPEGGGALAAAMAGRSEERPSQVLHEAVDGLTAAFGVDDRLGATYAMPWGPTTGAQLLGFELIELVVHGWDVARGLGVPLPVPDDVAGAALEGAHQWIDDSVRVPGMFGPEIEIADDAPPLDRLVAFLGRHPSWPATSDPSAVALN